MEDQNIKVEQPPVELEKKKKKMDVIGIVLAAVFVILFGPIPGVCGVAVAEALKKGREKKNPGKKANAVIGWVVGAVAGLALNLVLTVLLRAL